MHTETLKYLEGETECEGYFAYDSSLHGKLPLVLIFHAWGGRGQFVCRKAVEIAQLGYAALAVDMYGGARLGNSKEENSALIAPFIEDRGLVRRRALAALASVENYEMIDHNHIAAIGYCFGGLCALDLARSGADIKAVVSIHGLLMAPQGVSKESISASILVLHGHKDPLVPPEQVRGFEKEMEKAGVDWQIHIFGKALHAFTTPGANDPDFGTVYDEKSDRRSEKLLESFLKETIG